MSKPQYQGRSSFVAMSVFFVVVIILVHGTMAFQISKIKMNDQLKLASNAIMNQFIMSYSNFEHVKQQLTKETTAQYDEKLIQIYDKTNQAYVSKSYTQMYRPLTDDNLFEIVIKPCNAKTKKFLAEKIGVDMDALNPYELISMNFQGLNGKSINKRLLIGKTSNKQAVITIEMSVDVGSDPIEVVEKSMSSVLGNNLYMSNFASRFYVVTTQGEVLYNTGTKLNSGLIQAIDSYSGSSIKNLIVDTDVEFTDVLYKDLNGLNRSGLRIKRDFDTGVIYILELDQDKVFEKMNRYVQYFWYISFVIVVVNLGVISYFWRKNKSMTHN